MNHVSGAWILWGYIHQKDGTVGKQSDAYDLSTGKYCLVGRRGHVSVHGSVRDVQARDRGFDPGCAEYASMLCSLGKALCSHVHSLDPGVSVYLVGQ